MRLCWNDWFNRKLADIQPAEAKAIRDIGYRVAGVNSGHADASDEDIARLRSIMDDHDLVPGPFGGGATTFHPDPERCRQTKAKLRKTIAIAGKLGCPTIRISGGTYNPDNSWAQHPKNHTQKAMDEFVENTRELIPVAEDNNVVICPETTQWTIIDGVERMKEFVDRCDSPFVKVVFDPVNHMNMQRVYESGRYMRCALAILGDRIGVIHVKDVNVAPGLVVHLNEEKMGEGMLDHAALLEASEDIEPWKTLSLEHIGYDYTNPEHVELVKSAHDHIRGVAAQIGHTFTDPSMTKEAWEAQQ